MTHNALLILTNLEQAFGTDPFTFAEARQHGLAASSTLACLRGEGYVQRLTSRRQGGSDPSRTLWAITPTGVTKAQWWRDHS